jgi:hypothetical protein
MLLVGLVDKICFKTLFVGCKDIKKIYMYCVVLYLCVYVVL